MRAQALIIACVLSVVPIQSVAVAAAEVDHLLTGYSVTSWADANGRPLGTVYAIAQDRLGYLWIGSDAGLFRFDGSRFTPWDQMSDVSLPESPVTALCVLRDGSLLIGFADDSGLRRVSAGEVRMLPQSGGPAAISDLLQDSSGTIWAVGDGSLFSFSGARWQKASLKWGERDARVRQVYALHNGDVLAGTWLGTFRLDKKTRAFVRLSGGLVWGLTEDSTGTIWTTDIEAGFRRLGTANALQHRLEGAGHRLMFDREGGLWVATFGAGLWHVGNMSNQVPERAGLRTGLSSDLIQVVMEDRDGNIWTGTTGGLHRLTQRKLNPVENVGYVFAIAPADHASTVWLGGANGIVLISRDRASTIPSIHLQVKQDVRSLYVDPKGRLWVGAIEGLFRLASRELIPVVLPIRPRPQVTSISSDARGGLWLGDGNWLYHWDGSHLVPFDAVRPNGTLTRITFAQTDRNGHLWAAFASGRIGVFEGHRQLFEFPDDKDRLNANTQQTVHAIVEDDDGVMWISGTRGLTRFTGGRFSTVNHKNGLPGDEVWSVVADRRNRLWLSVDRGLVCVDRRELNRALDDPSYLMHTRLYDALDGLAGGPFGLINSARASDGTVWFIQGGGVTWLEPGDVDEKSLPVSVPPAYIETVLGPSERLFNPVQQFSFPPGTRRLQIDYTAVMLSAPNRMRFRYKLDGIDTDWVDAGTRRTAFYTNLTPGRYRFRVETGTEEGIWNASTSDWTFVILPAFYQARWFYVLCASAVLLAIWGTWRFRLGLMKRRFSLVLAERVRLSREIHDTLLQSLMGVVLQVDGIAKTLAVEPGLAQKQLVRVRRQVEGYIRETRESIKNLRSPLLRVKDVATALRDFGQESVAQTSIHFTMTTAGSIPHWISLEVEAELLRIGQEAIINAIRHASPMRIEIELDWSDESVTLIVADDGCGFDYETWALETENRYHYGLITMKERADQLGGNMTISTCDGGVGTRIEVVIPSLERRRALSA